MQWGDLLTFEYGKPVKDKACTDGNVPVFGTNGQIGTSHLEPLCKIPSFIVGRKGAYRGVHYSPIPFSVIDTGFYAKPLTDSFDLKWAYYKFLTYDINSMDSGSAIPSTDRYELYKIPIDLPPIEQQRKVVSVLDSFNAKIDINNKINRNLSEQLRTLFKALFRDNKDDSWKTIPLGDALTLIIDHRGLTPKKLKSEWSEEGILALSAKNVKNDTLVNIDACNKVDEQLYEKWMPEKLQSRDILMTSEAPLGEFYYLAGFCEYCLSQRLFAMRANNSVIEPTVLYFQLSDPIGKRLIEGRQSGTTVTGIRQSELVKIPIMIPDKESQKQFAEIANPIMEQIENNFYENMKLMNLRDSLLPKLMSGEIDISNLEI